MNDGKNASLKDDNEPSVKDMTLEEAFLEYGEYIRGVCTHFCRQWGNRPYVDDDFLDDLIGEAFHRFPLARESFRGDAKFTTYLYRIVLNIFHDMTSKARRDRGLADSPGGPSASDRVKLRDLGVNTDDLAPNRGVASMHTGGRARDAEVPMRESLEPGIDHAILAAIEIIMKPRRDGEEPGSPETAPLEETQRILREGIRELEKPFKIAVGTIYFIEQETQKAVARRLNRSQAAVSDQVAYIRKHLLDYIARRFPEAGELVAKIRSLAAERGGKDG